MPRRHECSPPAAAPVGTLWTCSRCWCVRQREAISITGPAPAGKWSAEGWTPVRADPQQLPQHQLKALHTLVRWGRSSSLHAAPNTLDGLVVRKWVEAFARGHTLAPEYAITDAGQRALAGHRAFQRRGL